MHFAYTDADVDRTFYWRKLTAALNAIGKGDYYKNRPDMYAVLRPFIDTAIINARKLDKRNAGKVPSNAAPGTKVYELIEKLKPYL